MEFKDLNETGCSLTVGGLYKILHKLVTEGKEHCGIYYHNCINDDYEVIVKVTDENGLIIFD
jgi:hypothetical protein